MAAVRAFIDTVNELAQAPLRAGSRVLRGAGSHEGAGAKRPSGRARVAIEPSVAPDAIYARGNAEPRLEELLGDPLVHQVMRADRLEPADVRRMFEARAPLGS